MKLRRNDTNSTPKRFTGFRVSPVSPAELDPLRSGRCRLFFRPSGHTDSSNKRRKARETSAKCRHPRSSTDVTEVFARTYMFVHSSFYIFLHLPMDYGFTSFESLRLLGDTFAGSFLQRGCLQQRVCGLSIHTENCSSQVSRAAHHQLRLDGSTVSQS